MVVGAASLAQRAHLCTTPMLVSAAAARASTASSSSRFVSASRQFSLAATPKTSSSVVRTSAYNSATFTRASLAFPAQSTLLSGKPFSSSIAHRSLSLWGGGSKSNTAEAKAETWASEVEAKKDEALEGASELKQSVEAKIDQASSTFSDGLQSTQQAASDAAATVQSKASELSSNVTDQFNNIDPTSLSTVTEAFGGAAGIKAGELSALGLNHWVSPPGWLTNLLEFVGTHTGLPWWGTIAVTTIALRLLISPINVAGQKNAIRLGNIQPQMKRNMDDIKHYKAAGDQMQMQKAVMATQKLLRDNNCNPFKSLVPIAFQLPLMFSFYLALKRIADSGLESFAHGGPFWTTDLTLPDPTWILPAVSTLATFAVAELGFKVGTNAQSDPSQSQMMKYIFRGFMPILAWFSTTFPSGVLVYWATTNLFSLLQLAVLQIPIVRKWARFPKRIQHPKNPYEQQSKSFMDKIKAARDQMGDSSSANRVAKPVVSNNSAVNSTTGGSRSDALKEILDDKAAYEATGSKGAAAHAEAAAAQRNRERVLKARQRRARQ
ncbi:related to OXA1 - cytochrome oxidase biogenesis protein, mitochondrial [Ustilago trichophora]|uniref:Related to OXA1 - cytochrome oxidase biogenesis protein, mitochondrial n=1 Tax=Ustilago trichophora TaxID=86804 RepID=A0A5C3ERL7_9BASI|nr:related to OXA1 - cytochrome oxidase biogenesis protein, mitochondrial [Ustilago trichophora]